MRAAAALVLVVTALGCSSGRLSRSPEATPQRAPVAVTSANTQAPPLPLPPPLQAPTDIACTLTAESWPREMLEDSREGQVFLRFGVGGPAFAELYSGTAVRLELPVALASAGGTLTLEAQGVFVQGHLEAAEMPLYPATAFVMSGVFVPNRERRLLWRSARAGLVTLATQPIHRVDTIGREFSAERACRDVSLGTANVDAAAIDQAMRASPAPAQLRRPWPWLRQGPVTLSAAPGGEIVAVVEVLEPRDDSLIIHSPRVLSVENGFTRIALETFGGVLFGWVPSARLTTSTAEYVDLSHDCFTSLGRERPPSGDFVACDHDVPLVAEAGGQRRLVGTIRAGARLERLRAVAGWRELAFPDAGIVAAEGASFWSRESDLVNCRR